MPRNGFLGDRAQASFEYVLIAAGVVLLVTIVILITRGQVVGSINQQAGQSLDNFSNLLGQFNRTK